MRLARRHCQPWICRTQVYWIVPARSCKYLSRIFQGCVDVPAKFPYMPGRESVHVRDLCGELSGSTMDTRHTATPYSFSVYGTTFDIQAIAVFFIFSFIERHVPILILNTSSRNFELFLRDLGVMTTTITRRRKFSQPDRIWYSKCVPLMAHSRQLKDFIWNMLSMSAFPSYMGLTVLDLAR